MKYYLRCVALISFSFLAPSAMATPLDDKVAALKKAISDEIALKPAATNANGPMGNPGIILASLDELVTQVNNNPNMGGNAEMQLNQVISIFTSDAVQKAKQELIAEIQAERKAKADALASQAKNLLKHVSDEVNNSKKPEDLDNLLVELQQFLGERNSTGYGTENQAIFQQVSGAFEFTKLWQNYLSHLANGQGQLASNDLQGLSQNNYAVGIMPRSHILELMGPTNAPSVASGAGQGVIPTSSANDTVTMLKNIKTLDDMRPTKEKIEEVQRANPGYYAGTDNILKQLIDIYEGAKMGLPVDIGLNVKYFSSNSVSPELQRQLVLYVFQKYFATYVGAPPGANENPSIYVNRVVTDAVSRQDWTLLKQALNVQEFLDENSSERQYNNRQSLEGVNALLAGINQDAASQYMLAVKSYQNALKDLPENTILPKFIGDKLAAIQKDHPQEYEKGMQLVLNPPQSPVYVRQGYPAGMTPQPNTPIPAGSSTNVVPTPTAPVAIPSAAPSGVTAH